MNNRMFLSLFQTRIYWLLRGVMAQVLFWIEARIFGFRYLLKAETFNYLSLSHILSITQKPLFFAAGFAALLQYIDPYLYPYFQKVALGIPDDSDYVTFLATVSSIGGVFIGLYYAGISTVSSAIYARVPNNVRDLLAQERVGNVYLRFLSFLTSLGLILISFRLMNMPRIFLAIPIVTVFAGIGIISFVKLGQRAFYLFDPTKLSHYIFEQMQHWIEMVKAGGFRWMDKSFQNHAHRQASSILDTLETLADITAKEPHLNGKPFINLSQSLLQFLIRSEYEKRFIPTESSWYEQRYQHRDWYRTDGSQVAMAHHTGTTLQPIEIKNTEWVEDRVIFILKRCIEVNLLHERYTEILGLFGYLEAYLKRLGLEGRAEKAFALLNDLGLIILSHLAAPVDGDPVKAEVLEKIAIAEHFALLPIAVALGYREKIEKLQREDIENRVSSIRWDKDISIYRHNFPAYCLARLEWFKPRINFEREVEGKEVTPLWYLTELVCQVEAEQFTDNSKALVLKGVDFYKKCISKALANKHPWIAASIISREWEYWHKISDQIRIWPAKWDNLSGDRRVDGLPWPGSNIETLKADSDNRQKELLKLMSQQNVLLALWPRPEGYPDFSGQFLHTSGEVTFKALLENDIDTLKGVFRPYLYGCLLRFDSLRPKSASTDWRDQQEFKIAAAAILDVMDISGYARLLADYHGNISLWDEIKTIWDDYLAQENETPRAPLLAGSIIFTDSAFEIPHRGILRTSWQLEIKRRLRDVPRHEEHYRGSFTSHSVVDHESALVRIFARGRSMGFHDGIDIFIEYYLRHLDSVKDFDFGRKRSDLRNSIDIQIRNRSKKDDKEGVEQ